MSPRAKTQKVRYLQAKHKQNEETEKITSADLLSDNNGEFSLPKYFRLYQNDVINRSNKCLPEIIQDCPLISGQSGQQTITCIWIINKTSQRTKKEDGHLYSICGICFLSWMDSHFSHELTISRYINTWVPSSTFSIPKSTPDNVMNPTHFPRDHVPQISVLVVQDLVDGTRFALGILIGQ